ncbi:MAG: hypothetical protein OXH39_08140 [Candidatus Poribacteria bacterium]|nr:hypothetical protein [Candidatus Poribacteria bacterium]
MKNDDVELIHRVLGGDDSAFCLIVEKYQAPIHELTLRKTGDARIAEEITEDIFLKVHQKLDMLKEPQGFESWIHVIATHCCIDWLRKKRLARQLFERPNTETEAQSK